MSGALGWQDLAAGGLAALAVAWLVRGYVRRRRSHAPACSDCPGCASPKGGPPVPAPPQFIALSDLTGPPARKGPDPRP